MRAVLLLAALQQQLPNLLLHRPVCKCRSGGPGEESKVRGSVEGPALLTCPSSIGQPIEQPYRHVPQQFQHPTLGAQQPEGPVVHRL